MKSGGPQNLLEAWRSSNASKAIISKPQVNDMLRFFIIYLKASPLPPAPLAVAGFMVAGLAAWQYSDRLVGLLGFAVWVLFC